MNDQPSIGLAASASVLICLFAACGCSFPGGSREQPAAPPESAGASERAATRPFGGKPHAIPGLIEAEHFDEGPEGVAYYDVDQKNHGAPYRQTSVDIEERSDASGGYGIGWTRAGEWLAYTVEVAETGTYEVEIPVASAGKGGTFHIEFDGADKTGSIDVPDTGSWQKLEIISKGGLELEAGRRLMRVVMDTEGATKSVADIDYFRFRRVP
jgi:hypothetical protein